MGEFSLTHLLILGVVVLIFFGPSRLPALGQSFGKAIRGFKQGLKEIDAEAKPVTETPAAFQANQQLTAQTGPQAGTAVSQNQTEKETSKA